MTAIPARPTARTTVFLVLAAVAAAALATTLIALVATALGAATGFPPLQPPAFLSFATIGALAAIGGWVLVARQVPRSARLLRVLVPALVVFSLVPDIILLFVPFIAGATPAGTVALMLMHPTVAAIAVLVGRRIAPARDAR